MCEWDAVVCCSVLQGVAVCCSVWQCVARCCTAVRCVVCDSVLQYVAVRMRGCDGVCVMFLRFIMSV